MSAHTLARSDEIVELMLEAPPGQVIKYDKEALCSALGVSDDPARVVVETSGRQAIVTIYPFNPLAVMPPPSPSDMLMDRYGRIVVGRHHNGRPARRRLFDPRTGSAVRAFVLGTTGAGKSRTVQYTLAAEKRNRIVSWYGDLKGGQSAPESEGQVDWRATSQEEVVLMLRAAVAVAQARQRRYAALGRNAFLIGDPDPLMSVRLDEANRGLERGAPYRDEMTYWIKELGRTGRSVGIGIELDAQASHLEELGGSDTLRAMLKEGEIVLLRWSSSMMAQLVADGLLSAAQSLTPIPKQFKPVQLRSQFDLADDDDDFCDTQGTAYLLSSSTPTSMMRHWRIGSIAPLPGLDPEILALYGPGEPAQLEEASWDAAGAAYAARHDQADMAALCAELREELSQKGRGQAGPGGDDEPEGGARRRPRLLADRVMAALADAGAPMSVEDVLASVNADGGRQVKSANSVRNALRDLVNAGDVARGGHGMYVLQNA
ncbi:transfer protein [Nonomuraea rhodomycinica]|uniref:Transfer protein n=1 Tax=Nonomuraea rhodomycinica TaxID=1712872 RepID=A0A7Y6IX79_9ACTN|nr:transfer protein [Nonomuraea rhodomycinica]NUW45518.1 transfer protein [Nonomuraea rhodomycinica]